MPTEPYLPRWAAPSHERCHPRLALIKHRGRLYSFSELMRNVPPADLPDGDASALSAQALWDDLAARAPTLAERAARLSVPRDFEVLDLYACQALGSA